MAKSIAVILNLKDKFSTPLKDIAKKLDTTEQKLKKATNTVGKFSNQTITGFRNAALAVGGMGVAFAGAVGVAVKTTLDYAKEVKKMQRLTGASVEEASKMVAVGKKYGISADGMAKSLRMLSIKATNNGKDFAKYGLTVKDAHGQLLPASTILEKVADKYQQLGGGLKGAVFAQKLMGKSAMEMIPLLSKGSAGLKAMEADAKRMGLVLSKDNMADFSKFSEAQKRFNQAMLAINVTIGAKVLPILGQLSEKVNVAITKFDFRQVGIITNQVFNGIGNTIKFVVNNLNWIIPVASAAMTSILAFKAISTVMSVFTTLNAVVKALGITQGIWNATMLLNPIGLVVVGIGALVGIGVALYMNWDKICKKAFELWDWLKKLTGFGDKTVSVNVIKTEKTSGDSSKSPGKKPKIPNHSTGTNYFKGGLTHINEHGLETIDLPPGSKINPYNNSKKNNAAKGINLTLIIKGNVIGNKEFADEIGCHIYNKLNSALALA